MVYPLNQGHQDGKKWLEKNAINMDTRLTIKIETLLNMKFALKSRSVTSFFNEPLQSAILSCTMSTCCCWFEI